MISYILISLLSLFAGGVLAEALCRDAWFMPRWTAGFYKGYELGMKHGIEIGESNAKFKEWDERIAAEAEEFLKNHKAS
jgi:hypothetical protein